MRHSTAVNGQLAVRLGSGFLYSQPLCVLRHEEKRGVGLGRGAPPDALDGWVRTPYVFSQSTVLCSRYT